MSLRRWCAVVSVAGAVTLAGCTGAERGALPQPEAAASVIASAGNPLGGSSTGPAVTSPPGSASRAERAGASTGRPGIVPDGSDAGTAADTAAPSATSTGSAASSGATTSAGAGASQPTTKAVPSETAPATSENLGPAITVYGNYAGGSVNIRSGPATSFPVVGALPYGRAVTARLLGDRGWYELDPGRYVAASVVSTKAPSARAPSSPASGSRPAAGPSSPPTKVARPPDSVVTDAVLPKVNEYRSAAGLPGLRRSSCADASALIHAKAQAKRHAMYHRTLPEIENACKMPGGENIAFGYRDITQTLAGWYRSVPHRENMLNPQYTYMGAAVAYSTDGTPYYTQVFYIG